MEPVGRVVRHFQEELEQLKTRLLEMGGAAEEQVRLATKALAERDYFGLRRIPPGPRRCGAPARLGPRKRESRLRRVVTRS